MSLGKGVMKAWDKRSDKIRSGIHKNATTILATTAASTVGAALADPGAGALAGMVGGAVGAAAGNAADMFRSKLAKLRQDAYAKKKKGAPKP